MSTKQILVDARPYPEGLERLRALPDVVVHTVEPFWPSGRPARPLPADLIKDVHVYFGWQPPSNLTDMTRLELIQLTSVGYAQLYGLNLAQRTIRVCNARGACDTSIAEWNLAMMVNLTRDLRDMIRNQEHGVWEVASRFAGEIRGATLGLIGYGGIGRETARLASLMGMTVHVFARGGTVGPRNPGYFSLPGTGDPTGSVPAQVFGRDRFHEFLGGVDFLVLALPYTQRSSGLLGEAEFQAMKPSAFVLNPARGLIIDEAALLKALRARWIAGAALDTHFVSPLPADHPLWRFPNVIMTPHISGSELSPLYRQRLWDILLQNIQRLQAGGGLWNELTAGELNGQA